MREPVGHIPPSGAPAWRAIAIVVAVGALLSVPLLVRGVPLSTASSGHDSDIALRWSLLFSRQFWEGNLYPHWLTGGTNGFGSAVFYFYPPLAYWVYSLLDGLTGWFLTPDITLCVALTLAMVLSGVTCFTWLRHVVSERSALIGSIFYMAAPYHAGVDVFVRTAFAECFAFIVVPLVFLGVELLGTRIRSGLLVIAFSFFSLVLTHVPTALLCGGIATVYAGVLYWRQPRCLAVFAAGVLLGVGGAAFYLVPALTLAKYTRMHTMTEGYFKYDRWFLDASEFRSGSDRLFASILTQLGLSATAVSALWFVGRRIPIGAHRDRWIGALAAAGVAIVLMTSLSSPVWAYAPLLAKVQFPWRLMIVLTALSAMLLAIQSDRAGSRHSWWVVLTAVVLGLGPTIQVITSSSFEYGAARMAIASMSPGEGDYVIDFWTGDIGLDRFASNATPAFIPDGDGDVVSVHPHAGDITAVVNIRTPTTVTVRQQYFVDWLARVDGNVVSATPSTPHGLVSVPVAAGTHTIVLSHRLVGEQIAGLGISAGALLLLVAVSWWLSRAVGVDDPPVVIVAKAAKESPPARRKR